MKHLKKFETYNKKYIYKYDNYYYYVDDEIGDMLVTDIEFARKFSEKELIYFNLNDSLKYITEIYCEDEDKMIKIIHPFEKIEIN